LFFSVIANPFVLSLSKHCLSSGALTAQRQSAALRQAQGERDGVVLAALLAGKT